MLGIERGWWGNHSKSVYPLFAALTWAFVMYLFEFEKRNISQSMAASMEYLYHNDRDLTLSIPGVYEWITN